LLPLLALFSASLGHKKGDLKDKDHRKKKKLVRKRFLLNNFSLRSTAFQIINYQPMKHLSPAFGYFVVASGYSGF
jgi:hypothetical protein